MATDGIRYGKMGVCNYGGQGSQRTVQWGASKSLARPGRKQATATKFGFIQQTPHEAQYTS